MDDTVSCPSCQLQFQWNASVLRNPIQPPPAKAIKPWRWPPLMGGYLCLIGVIALLSSRSSPNSSMDFVGGLILITVGLGLCFLNRIRARFGRYGRWAASVDGHRYNAIQRDMETAAGAFAWVAAEKRAAEEREKRARDARDRHYLLTLSPRDFERHIGDLFAALGYAVQLTAASHDEGIDAFLRKDGRRALVQCKRLTDGAVSRPALQQFYGVLQDKGIDEGFFITTGRFSKHATEFAEGKAIHLIDLEKLVEMASGAFPVRDAP